MKKNPLIKSTLLLLLKNNQILLAMKKRGFGKGKWNGVGGKIKQNETAEEATIRETKEEIGITPLTIKKRAVINFYFPNNPEWNCNVSVYTSKKWIGKPIETEEMKPKWFNTKKIPYNKMWSDDKHWLPLILDGKNLKAEFIFNENNLVESLKLSFTDSSYIT